MTSTLAVCIPTFNGRHLLALTLPSVLSQRPTPDRIVVVDDGSTDGTVEWLAAVYPGVQVIVHPRNEGIAAALNTALKAGSDLDFVALLNNDVELAPEALNRLIAALQSRPGAAAAGPKMLNYYARDFIDGTGDSYCRLGTAHRRGQGRPDTGQYDTPGPVFGVCAGAAVYRTSAVVQVGGFDSDFFAYYEDVDWAFRANLAGYFCWYEPSAIVFHMASATVGAGPSPFTGYHCWRNAIWLIVKNWRGRDVLNFSWLLLLGQIGNALVAAQEGLLKTLLRAWFDALRGLPVMLRKRRAIDRSRSVKLPLVVRQFNWLKVHDSVDDRRR